jgi:hypothetical protein
MTALSSALFTRDGVTGYWKFFLDDEEWLNLWAHRHGESGAWLLLRNAQLA